MNFYTHAYICCNYKFLKNRRSNLMNFNLNFLKQIQKEYKYLYLYVSIIILNLSYKVLNPFGVALISECSLLNLYGTFRVTTAQ